MLHVEGERVVSLLRAVSLLIVFSCFLESRGKNILVLVCLPHLIPGMCRQRREFVPHSVELKELGKSGLCRG